MFQYTPILFLLILSQTLAEQPDDIRNFQFSGQYRNKGPNNLFNYLDSQVGNIDTFFISNSREDSSKINEVIFQLYDPKYHDLKVIDIAVNISDYDKSNQRWVRENVEMDVYAFYKESRKNKQTCHGSYVITLNHEDGAWNPKRETVSVQLVSTGEDLCSFNFTASGVFYDDRYKVLAYCGFVSAVILIQLGCSYVLMRQIASNEVIPDKLSLLTICIATIQDFYLTMMHLYFLMTDSYEQYFILPIFLLVLLSIVFDMRLLFVVWRTKYSQEINNGQLKRKITIFYIQFYLGMFSYLIVMYFFTYDIWPLYLQALVFLPQIVHNVRKGNNPKFYYAYVLGLLGMRLILPVYYRGCADNIYHIEPNLAFCITWSSLFLVQILILLLQHKCGPRFFIPKKFIPGYFNYTHKIEVMPEDEPPECNICIQSLVVGEMTSEGINSSMVNELIKKKATVMRTPCNHLFHPECLRHWMDVKLECPTCRLQLPPLT